MRPLRTILIATMILLASAGPARAATVVYDDIDNGVLDPMLLR